MNQGGNGNNDAQTKEANESTLDINMNLNANSNQIEKSSVPDDGERNCPANNQSQRSEMMINQPNSTLSGQESPIETSSLTTFSKKPSSSNIENNQNNMHNANNTPNDRIQPMPILRSNLSINPESNVHTPRKTPQHHFPPPNNQAQIGSLESARPLTASSQQIVQCPQGYAHIVHPACPLHGHLRSAPNTSKSGQSSLNSSASDLANFSPLFTGLQSPMHGPQSGFSTFLPNGFLPSCSNVFANKAQPIGPFYPMNPLHNISASNLNNATQYLAMNQSVPYLQNLGNSGLVQQNYLACPNNFGRMQCVSPLPGVPNHAGYNTLCSPNHVRSASNFSTHSQILPPAKGAPDSCPNQTGYNDRLLAAPRGDQMANSSSTLVNTSEGSTRTLGNSSDSQVVANTNSKRQ